MSGLYDFLSLCFAVEEGQTERIPFGVCPCVRACSCKKDRIPTMRRRRRRRFHASHFLFDLMRAPARSFISPFFFSSFDLVLFCFVGGHPSTCVSRSLLFLIRRGSALSLPPLPSLPDSHSFFSRPEQRGESVALGPCCPSLSLVGSP